VNDQAPEGNILFLVCRPCEQAEEKDFGVKLCGRTRIGYYEHLVPERQFDAWLMKHRKCGGRDKPDHFVLAHSYIPNHDQQEIKPIPKAVKLSLVN
jgi:hypothetical protein